MQRVEFNTLFHLTFPESHLKFGSLPYDKLCAVLRDGRPCSFLLEALAAEMFQMTLNTGKGIDYLCHDGRLIESKVYTKNGCNFSPSSMKGMKRIYEGNVFLRAARETDFLISDVTHFPDVKMTFKHGKDLLALTGNKAVLTPKMKKQVFTAPGA